MGSAQLVETFDGWNSRASAMTLEAGVWRDADGTDHWMNDPTNPFIKDTGERAYGG